MTTLTMILGMMPMAIGSGAGGEFRSGMGVVIIGGLTSSLLLTLVLVPVMYTLLDRFTLKKKVDLASPTTVEAEEIQP